MKHLLRVLTSPSCWLRSAATNKELDAAINKLLDAGVNITADGYMATLGPIFLWAEAFPYIHGGHTVDGIGLPSRRTVFRLYDTTTVIKDINENQKNAEARSCV